LGEAWSTPGATPESCGAASVDMMMVVVEEEEEVVVVLIVVSEWIGVG
jgi:hypothetical protein